MVVNPTEDLLLTLAHLDIFLSFYQKETSPTQNTFIQQKINRYFGL